MLDSPELLLPAGNFEKMKFALAYGADAVYAGVPEYSLRARENGFTPEYLKKAVEYCHARGKKIYFTANIFPHNVKIPHFLRALQKMVKLDPDGFIMSDPGIISLTKEKFPDAKIHLSVQANNVNWASAKFWNSQGIERIILSREISLREIQEITKKNPDLDFECFVHGSVCIAYSGRCLLSNYFSYRDANQGTCAHSCRWNYQVYEEKKGENEKKYSPLPGKYYLEEAERKGEMMEIDEDEYGSYIMNARDLCLLEYLPDLLKARVLSLKIEGRSKTEYYTAIIARTYRMALDAIRDGKYTKEFMESLFAEVASTSNRGFIPGFLPGNPKEKAVEYENHRGSGTHLYAGIVRSRKGQILEIEVRNRIDRGDTLEFLFPEKKNDFSVTLGEFQTDKGKTVGSFSGGAGNIFVKIGARETKVFEKAFGKDEIFSLLRKRIP